MCWRAYRIGRRIGGCRCILSRRAVERQLSLRGVNVFSWYHEAIPYCLPCPAASPRSRKLVVGGRWGGFAGAEALVHRRVHLVLAAVVVSRCIHLHILHQRVSTAPSLGVVRWRPHQLTKTAALGLLRLAREALARVVSAEAWR